MGLEIIKHGNPENFVNILLVEDNYDLALNITEYFESKDHIVDYAADGMMALNLLSQHDFDVIVLDIVLPGIDGFKLCQRLRENLEKETPVIMLTAKDTEQDKLKGFGVGTDDYMVKPFSLPELEARLIALTRRNSFSNHESKNLVVEDLVYNHSTMQFTRDNVALKLKPVPRKILVILMRHSNRVVTRQEIEQEIWKDDPPDSEVLRAHIYAIRREIENTGAAKLLHTIHGVGYRLAVSQS